MAKKTGVDLTFDEKELLVDLLLSQNYAIEIVCAELSDIENGLKTVDLNRFEQLTSLYDKLRLETITR
jgi:MinD-like ATPase involved in chromosome partitioning or flagellar assembly